MNTAILLLEIQNELFPKRKDAIRKKSLEASNKAQLILNVFREIKSFP